MQRYAAWKAADIRKALREGRTPTPGAPGDDLSANSAASGQQTVNWHNVFTLHIAPVVTLHILSLSSIFPDSRVFLHTRGVAASQTAGLMAVPHLHMHRLQALIFQVLACTAKLALVLVVYSAACVNKTCALTSLLSADSLW